MDRRLQTAQEELAALGDRRQGKKRLTAAEMRAAAAQLVEQERVADLVEVTVRTTTRTKAVRGYGDCPARVEKEQEDRVEVSLREAAIGQAKAEMGWRVYATNPLPMTLAGVVWGYRGQTRGDKRGSWM